jgi:hypothetical protein
MITIYDPLSFLTLPDIKISSFPLPYPPPVHFLSVSDHVSSTVAEYQPIITGSPFVFAALILRNSPVKTSERRL